jgi:hypothetical protein
MERSPESSSEEVHSNSSVLREAPGASKREAVSTTERGDERSAAGSAHP